MGMFSKLALTGRFENSQRRAREFAGRWKAKTDTGNVLKIHRFENEEQALVYTV
jgi:hypothetical protein